MPASMHDFMRRSMPALAGLFTPRRAAPGRRSGAGLIGIAGLLLAALACVPAAATPVHKCLVDGRVSYQQEPCRTGPRGPRPNIDELNAREKQRRADAAAAAAASASASASASKAASGAAATPASDPSADSARTGTQRAEGAPAPATPADAFRCDGRRYCSQMRSCAEAKYFLARCPGVAMDGDGNGVPCERQWCRP